MAKDHYVAQTYLRKFSIEGQDGLVNVVRKSNLQKLDAIPVNSICSEKNWSTNKFFPNNPRIVEEFLGAFEPKWTECVQQISSDTYDATTKYLMAGYLAYLRMCTPTAVRLGTLGLADFVKDVYDKLEEKELGKADSKYREVIETIRKHGGTKVDVDSHYPTAMGISNLISIQKVLATSPWIVFRNETPVQLLTSDNPVCLQYHNTGFADFYCPLTPHLAIVIHPVKEPKAEDVDYAAGFKPEGVVKMNTLVVQSAEDLVIYNKFDDAQDFVSRNQDWRVELQITKIPVERGNLILHQQRPVKVALSDSKDTVNV